MSIAMGKGFFLTAIFPLGKWHFVAHFWCQFQNTSPSSPATSEGVFAEIFSRPFGIFNKMEVLFVLGLTIWPRSWTSVKNQNSPKLPWYTQFFCFPGHDLVNFSKKYWLPPSLVPKGFKSAETCDKIWILEPKNLIFAKEQNLPKLP